MRQFVVLNVVEGIGVGLSVELIVVHIVSLILGLSVILSGGLGEILNVGPGVGLSFIWSSGWDTGGLV